MIFATCGSSEFRFDRMMEGLTLLPPDELEVQHGPANPPPCAQAFAYLPFGRIVEKIELADVVVSHAGVGTILCAIRAGHTPVIIPRLKRFGEVIDGHQAELAAALANHGTAMLVASVEDLPAAVAAVPPRRGRGISVSQQLIAAVQGALQGTPARTASLRA